MKEKNNDLSAMREVWLTRNFLKNVSQISRRIINADDEQLLKLITTSIDMSDQGLTDWRTEEIQFATFGTGNELSVFFIMEEIHLDEPDENSLIRKYTFLAAIADDVQVVRDEASEKGKLLKKLSRIAVKTTIAYRVYNAIKEAVSEALID